MGRTTFEPALSNDRWPWPNLDVFVLGSQRPRARPTTWWSTATRSGCSSRCGRQTAAATSISSADPRTIETFCAIGALDRLELVVLPLLLGDGMRLTPALHPDTELAFERERALPGGSVEIVYIPSSGASGLAGRDADWGARVAAPRSR